MILDEKSFRRPVRPAIFLELVAKQRDANKTASHPAPPKSVPAETPKTKPITTIAVVVKIAPEVITPAGTAKTETSVAAAVIRPIPDILEQFPLSTTSRKLSPAKYYQLTSPGEATLRNKWCWSRHSARTYGRKPRIEHRIVTVCSFASDVSVREVRRAFA